jgi:hypothetical protein
MLKITSLNFMFCWRYFWIYACNETNLMHYLSSVYSVTIPQHVSGLLVAHHQEVTMYTSTNTCDNLYVLYVLVDSAGPLTASPPIQYTFCLLTMGC